MSVSDSQRFKVSPNVLFEHVEGELVLMDLSSECYFGLDVVGSRVWSLLEGGATTAELVEKLLGEYEVEPVQLREDVSSLVHELFEAGLIEKSDERG